MRVIQEVGAIVAGIAAAIEEQSTVTKDVAGNIAQASAGVKEANERIAQSAVATKSVVTEIDGVHTAARWMATASANTATHADRTLKLADRLQAIGGRFRVTRQTFDPAPIKKGHIQWRIRIVEMLEGRLALKPEEVADHHSCALGKWYDGDGTKKLQHLPVFATIGMKHQAFHEKVREVVTLWNSGRRDEAHEQFTRLSAQTDELLGLLDALNIEAANAA